MGASSYLLIGFFYKLPSAVSASKKAFIVTRFADLGFLLGILILSYCTQTFDFLDITSAAVANYEGGVASYTGPFTGILTLILRNDLPRCLDSHMGSRAYLHGRYG